MALLQKLLNRFSGLDYRQEYLCLAKESFQQPLHAYLVENQKAVLDVTYSHNFVGYCPLIFAFPSGLVPNFTSELLQLKFTHRPFEQNEILREKDAIATLVLKKILQRNVDETIVSFYEGVKGRHHFLSGFHQSVIELNNRWYGKKPGNVFLKGNLYQQVQIGYAFPRKICLITVSQSNLFNLFPTDLHGQINEDYYVISLRHEGNACKQVDASGRIVLSDMDADSYKKVYSFGKNHMQPLKERTAFDFSANHSEYFRLALPNGIISYKELEVVSSSIAGIHKLILFKIIHAQKVTYKNSTLVHIHNSYATWRNKQSIEGNYLMR